MELNLRPAYEDRGLYRVQFQQIKLQWKDASSVAVAASVDEGPKYVLGEVQLIGDDLPVDAMRAATKSRKGDTANWGDIQKDLWAMEVPVRRTGYPQATARPERIFHDEQRVLDLKATVVKGPLHHFGQLRFTGLSSALEAKARKLWKRNPGDPYDLLYPRDFLREFFQAVDSRQFKRYDIRAERPSPDHVVDITLVFEPR